MLRERGIGEEVPGHSMGVVEAESADCPPSKPGGGIAQGVEGLEGGGDGVIPLTGKGLGMGWPGGRNAWKAMVGRAKQELLNVRSKAAKAVHGGWEKEDVMMVQCLEEVGAVGAIAQFDPGCIPVGFSAGGIGKRGALASMGGRLSDGDINGKNAGWVVEAAVLAAVNGNVGRSSGGREFRVEEP